MGLARTKLILSNPTAPTRAPIESEALADTGALHLCIPQHIALQIGLAEQDRREATLAEGGRAIRPYIGPLRVRFSNRQCFVGALVLGDEVLLGAIPMEGMDLVVRPMTQEVTVNPASPNIPSSVAKGLGNKLFQVVRTKSVPA